MTPFLFFLYGVAFAGSFLVFGFVLLFFVAIIGRANREKRE